MPKASEIRKAFIGFFKKQGHTFVPSTPVMLRSDPTLLFVNAGMVQFKDVFLGTGGRDYSRAVNSQKCIRVSGKHNDLEEVGRDTCHHTFFEMLGNWSFADYGKREAIAWAWELLTEVWALPKDRLYATVYVDDDEAGDIWRETTDLAPERIFRFDKDNFWEMGETGPCGPCSEIHFDMGPEPGGVALAADKNLGVNSGSDRFVEIWNLVFIQQERRSDGTLAPLKQLHVDTGMGFERICAVLQGRSSNYDTDLFLPLIERVSEMSGVDYDHGGEGGVPHRVIADHVRMLTFSLTDGVTPSNEGRGYVVRRILRRAARFGRELGVREPFLYRLVSPVVDIMGEAYPEIVARAQYVSQVVRAEEESFGVTLDRGLELFGSVARKIAEKGEDRIRGEDAFKLYDTYGFPLDLTVMMARERGLGVDEDSFRSLMSRRRELSRAEKKFAVPGTDAAKLAAGLEEGARSDFVGYETHQTKAVILGADKNSIVLDRTPFYPEGGGQVADAGAITGPGFYFQVKDAGRSGDLIIHHGEFTKGGPENAAAGEEVKAEIDDKRRLATACSHTATHILHRVLIGELGETATQAGSLVSPDYLRFDFHHYEKVADELLLTVEKKVSAEIRADRRVADYYTDYESAVSAGAMALFGEKYEQQVRVVEMEGFSRELCGGTHVSATGQIGSFVITAETSVAAGIRRIEALTGERAAEYLLESTHIVSGLERALSVRRDRIAGRINELLESRKALSRELAKARELALKSGMDDFIRRAETLPGGVKIMAKHVKGADMDELKGMGDSFREKAGTGACLFAAEREGKVLFVCAVTDDLVKGGKLKAGELVSAVARIAGGGGGGKPHMATAGGKNPEKIEEALAAFQQLVSEVLAGGNEQ